MKKIVFILTGIFILFFFFGCENDEPGESGNIKFLKATLGGCNGQKSLILNSIAVEKDTIVSSMTKDTLHIFVGINYTCCSPFETKASFSGESFLLEITDKCTNLSLCYCKCICYYTFDFSFTGVEKRSYPFKVMLTDPRQSGPVVFRQGVIDVRKL